MTWKFMVTAALVCASAISTINIFPELFQGQEMRSSDSEARERQFFDAPFYTIGSRAIERNTDPPGLGAAYTPLAGSAELPAKYNLDMPKMTMAFGTNDLNDLISKGSTVLPLPDSPPLELRLVSVVKRHGMEQIKAEHQGMVSTITRRGDNFFATVSSPLDSYRIEGGLDQSHVFPHRLLAQRTIRHQMDYRYVQ